MVINIEDGIVSIPNRKPDLFYKEFYEDWILEYYIGLNSFEECIKFQKEYDEKIDNNQYLDYPSKYKIQGYKEFIIENNSFKRNKEILSVFKRHQIAYESEAGDYDQYLSELINKCILALKQGFLVTNQLFILRDWVIGLGEYCGVGDL